MRFYHLENNASRVLQVGDVHFLVTFFAAGCIYRRINTMNT